MFGVVMARGVSATELERIADEVRAARECLLELVREMAELRERLAAATRGSAPPDEEAPARKLHSVQ